MKNKFAAVSSVVVLLTIGLTNCSSVPAEANQKLNIETVNDQTQSTVFGSFLSLQHDPTMLEAEAIKKAALVEELKKQQESIDNNTSVMANAIHKLKKYIGSNYGYGETPGYWDCSGLVRWFYLQQGIDLYHSATAESKSGEIVKNPKIGDIVAFHYGSANWSFHVGIYIGDGKVLHAYNPRADTLVSDVSQIEKENNAWASYTRIVQTN